MLLLARKYRPRGYWDDTILPHAAEIVRSYSTGVTLRQLFYRLVSDPEIDFRNSDPDYSQLSRRTSDLRRIGAFPRFIDTTRGIEQMWWNEDMGEAIEESVRSFRLDRSRGQSPLPFVVVEKATLVAQVRDWVDDQTIPVAALRGYSSETLDAEVQQFIAGLDRDVRILYLGDLDPEGEDIERNFRAQTGLDTERLAITPEQVEEFALPEEPGKSESVRAPAFIAKYGRLFQIEVEALDPDSIRRLVEEAVAETWDEELEQGVLVEEDAQREQGQAFIDGFGEEEA